MKYEDVPTSEGMLIGGFGMKNDEMNHFDGLETEEGSSASDQDSDDMPLAREALARRAPKKVCFSFVHRIVARLCGWALREGCRA